PTAQPSAYPTYYPSGVPSGYPSAGPSGYPTYMPSGYPTYYPSGVPSGYPTAGPSGYPTYIPTGYPTAGPTGWPSAYPTGEPTFLPTGFPTFFPTGFPTFFPSGVPSGYPSAGPSGYPTYMPSGYPTAQPSAYPTYYPSGVPSGYPSAGPSGYPTYMPSGYPTAQPSAYPTYYPSGVPSGYPTAGPSGYPTYMPSGYPTAQPSAYPTYYPSAYPTYYPSGVPSGYPTAGPSGYPTYMPSGYPTAQPSAYPTYYPSGVPSGYPTAGPSGYPTYMPSGYPTAQPSAYPTYYPSGVPSGYPSAGPSGYPTYMPSGYPTAQPSAYPTYYPSGVPSGYPTAGPSGYPTYIPTGYPTAGPTGWPSAYPTGEPTFLPTGFPTFFPTFMPTFMPTFFPTGVPSGYPTAGPTGWPSDYPTGYPTGHPTFVGETHAPTVGIIPNWGNAWGVTDTYLSPSDITQTTDYILGLANIYAHDKSALMLFDKLNGELSPYYLSWETTAAAAEGNNLYLAGTTENREPVLAKIDLEHKVLTWGKRLPSSSYTIVDVNIQANGQLVTTIENRHNHQSTGSILIEEHDATSGLTLSNQAYVSSLFTRPIFARPIKGMAFIDDNTYIAGQYTFQSQYLTCMINTVTADFYILSAGYPIANNLDRPLAITSGSNSLYLLTSSIRNANFYYNLVRLNQIESTLSMAESWPIRTDAFLQDIALMQVDNLDYLMTCGQASSLLFMVKLDEQGNKVKELNIFYGQKELTCASLTYTRGGVIATVQHYEGDDPVISTLFVDQNTFQPAQLPVGFEWAFSDEITFGASDLRLDRTSTQHITQTPLTYELFSGNMTPATDFIQFGLPVPSAPPSWRPSFRPSPPPSPVPSASPSSNKPSFRPSSYRPTFFGETNAPTKTDNPTGYPTGRPTYLRGAPSGQPTGQPVSPTRQPSIAERSAAPTRHLSPSPTTASPSVKSSPMPTLAKLENDDQSYSINWNAFYISITGIIVVGYATLSYFNCRKNKVSPAPAPTPEDIALMNFTDMVMDEIFNQEIADAVRIEEQLEQENTDVRQAVRSLVDTVVIMNTPAYRSSDNEEQEHIIENIQEVEVESESDSSNFSELYRDFHDLSIRSRFQACLSSSSDSEEDESEDDYESDDSRLSRLEGEYRVATPDNSASQIRPVTHAGRRIAPGDSPDIENQSLSLGERQQLLYFGVFFNARVQPDESNQQEGSASIVSSSGQEVRFGQSFSIR
ncbi:MAG: hypothetical protein P1U36_02945, partial [Legionellaceae bacterium]|nr:hypothetical protein [Legionellaceae bacterium]